MNQDVNRLVGAWELLYTRPDGDFYTIQLSISARTLSVGVLREGGWHLNHVGLTLDGDRMQLSEAIFNAEAAPRYELGDDLLEIELGSVVLVLARIKQVDFTVTVH